MRHLLRLLLVLLCFGHLSFAASATVRAESSAQGEMLRMQLGAEELPSSFGGYTGISAARGDYLGAGFSLAAAVPFIGDFAAAGKAIRSVTQVSRVSHSAAPVISAARVERAVGGAGLVDDAAKLPVGRLGNPMQVPGPQNLPTVINGRNYTGHALDQMQGRGLMPSVVEDTISTGVQSAGRDGAQIFTSGQARIIVNPNGSIKTVYPR